MALSQEYDFLFKLFSVGKSSLLLRFCDGVFHETFLPTIGVDFKIRTFDYQNKTIKTQIWDTAGQERFKTITSSYYKGAHGVIMIFDITDIQSFNDLDNWKYEIEKHASDDIIKLLVGNKADMEQSRQVTKADAMKYAEENDMKYIETSAKTFINVESAFFTLCGVIKDKVAKFDGQEFNDGPPKFKTLGQSDKIIGKKNKKKCC